MKLPSFFASGTWKDLHKFESLDKDETSIVFYAENKASMNHFQTLITELTEKLNFQILALH